MSTSLSSFQFSTSGDESCEMTSDVDRDQGWFGQPQNAVDRDDIVDAVKTEPEDATTTSGALVNGRSPTPPASERPQLMTSAAETATVSPEVKDNNNWSPPEVHSRRGSWESDCLSDAWSSVTSLPVLDDNMTAEMKPDGDREVEQPEAEVNSGGVIVVTDSSSPPSSVATRSDADKEVVASPAPVSVSATSGSDESVVRKLESFVESMNVRRSVKAAAWADPMTSLSSTSGLARPSFSVGTACRPLQPLNGLRGTSPSVLLPYYVPFKTADVVDHPLDLSSKMHHHAATMAGSNAAAAFVQTDDDASQDADDAVSSLESLQKQFGENSAMLERIGVRRHTASGVIALAGAGSAGRVHGPTSPLNGVGLYGPALNEPCVPPPCRPFPSRIADSDGPTPGTATCYDPSRPAAPVDRRAAARRLVRGQDAWMNGVTGRQRRSSVLRCLECNLSFWSLPELTLHMIKTAHYANIVRSSFVPGAPLPEMTSSPPTASYSSPIDSNSDSSDVDNVSGDVHFRQVASGSDFRLTRSTKRERETSPNDDDYAKRSKIWRPDCPSSSSHCPGLAEQPAFHATSPDGRLTPNRGDVEGQRRLQRGSDRDRAVTSSKSPEEERGAALASRYDWSPGRSDETSDDGGAARPPALTAMKDFITRSICELDRGKRRPPPTMPILPAPQTPRPAPQPPPPNDLLPPTMAFADLMLPLFPLAQFFPEQLLAASRALNFLPLIQSMARLYGDRLPGLDFPLFGPSVDCPVPNLATDDLGASKRPSSRYCMPADVGSFPDGKDLSKYSQINGGGSETKLGSTGRSGSGPDTVRPGSIKDAFRRQKLSPTSSCLTDDGLQITALDSLRGFVYGDRKRSEHARADRKLQRDGDRHVVGRSAGPEDDESGRRRPRQSPSISSVGDESVACALSPVAPDCRPDGPEAATMCGPDRSNDYDSRFDKYYRLARELAGQMH